MKKYVFLLIPIFFLASCGGAKKITSTAETMATAKVFNAHQNSLPDFETLATRLQLTHRTEANEQRITVSMRMKKDEIIWIRAAILGFTVAKAYITPEKVIYYETIGQTYFEGDYSLLSSWLGIEVDFEKTQNILLGQALFDLNSSEYTYEITQNKYKIQPKKQAANFIHSLFLYPGSFRVAATSVEQPEFERVFFISYGDYQQVENQFFPSKISVMTNEKGEQTNIVVEYKNIDLNVSVGFPFEVPPGYERIEL